MEQSYAEWSFLKMQCSPVKKSQLKSDAKSYTAVMKSSYQLSVSSLKRAGAT